MAIATIPRQLIKEKGLVLITKREYEELLDMKKMVEVKPTKAELKIIARGRKEMKKGNFVTLEELKKELGL